MAASNCTRQGCDTCLLDAACAWAVRDEGAGCVARNGTAALRFSAVYNLTAGSADRAAPGLVASLLPECSPVCHGSVLLPVVSCGGCVGGDDLFLEQDTTWYSSLDGRDEDTVPELRCVYDSPEGDTFFPSQCLGPGLVGLPDSFDSGANLLTTVGQCVSGENDLMGVETGVLTLLGAVFLLLGCFCFPLCFNSRTRSYAGTWMRYMSVLSALVFATSGVLISSREAAAGGVAQLNFAFDSDLAAKIALAGALASLVSAAAARRGPHGTPGALSRGAFRLVLLLHAVQFALGVFETADRAGTSAAVRDGLPPADGLVPARAPVDRYNLGAPRAASGAGIEAVMVAILAAWYTMPRIHTAPGWGVARYLAAAGFPRPALYGVSLTVRLFWTAAACLSSVAVVAGVSNAGVDPDSGVSYMTPLPAPFQFLLAMVVFSVLLLPSPPVLPAKALAGDGMRAPLLSPPLPGDGADGVAVPVPAPVHVREGNAWFAGAAAAEAAAPAAAADGGASADLEGAQALAPLGTMVFVGITSIAAAFAGSLDGDAPGLLDFANTAGMIALVAGVAACLFTHYALSSPHEKKKGQGPAYTPVVLVPSGAGAVPRPAPAAAPAPAAGPLPVGGGAEGGDGKADAAAAHAHFSWRLSHTLALANGVFTLFSLTVLGGAAGAPERNRDQLVAVAGITVASSLYALLQSRWPALKLFPADHSFRFLSLLKMTKVALKAQLVSGHGSREALLLAMFCTSSLVLAYVTYSGVRPLLRPGAQLRGVRRPRCLVAAYVIGFLFNKGMLVYVALLAARVAPTPPGFGGVLAVDLPLLLAAPLFVTVYVCNEAARFIEAAVLLSKTGGVGGAASATLGHSLSCNGVAAVELFSWAILPIMVIPAQFSPFFGMIFSAWLLRCVVHLAAGAWGG